MELSEILMAVFLIGGIGILAVFILLKICCKHPLLNTIFVFAASVSLIVTSFAMPVKEKLGKVELDWNWVLGQAISLFLMTVLTWAECAFDEEEYEVRETEWIGNNKTRETSKLESRSMFWTALGSSLGAAIVLTIINYAIFDSGIGLGIVGCLMAAFIIFITIKHWVRRIQSRRSYY